MQSIQEESEMDKDIVPKAKRNGSRKIDDVEVANATETLVNVEQCSVVRSEYRC